MRVGRLAAKGPCALLHPDVPWEQRSRAPSGSGWATGSGMRRSSITEMSDIALMHLVHLVGHRWPARLAKYAVLPEEVRGRRRGPHAGPPCVRRPHRCRGTRKMRPPSESWMKTTGANAPEHLVAHLQPHRIGHLGRAVSLWVHPAQLSSRAAPYSLGSRKVHHPRGFPFIVPMDIGGTTSAWVSPSMVLAPCPAGCNVGTGC